VPSYNTAVQEAKDDALIALYGERRGQPLDFAMIRDATLARATAQRLLQRSTAVLNQYEFTLGWRHLLLEPMDWGYITDATLGLVRAPVRIIEVSESPDGKIAVVAEDYPGGGSMVPGTIAGGASGGVGSAEHARVAGQRAAAGDLRGARQSREHVGARALDRRERRGSELGRLQCLDEYRRRRELSEGRVQPQGSIYGSLTAALAAWGAAPALDTTNRSRSRWSVAIRCSRA
jgi:hypothetical protein